MNLLIARLNVRSYRLSVSSRFLPRVMDYMSLDVVRDSLVGLFVEIFDGPMMQQPSAYIRSLKGLKKCVVLSRNSRTPFMIDASDPAVIDETEELIKVR